MNNGRFDSISSFSSAIDEALSMLDDLSTKALHNGTGGYVWTGTTTDFTPFKSFVEVVNKLPNSIVSSVYPPSNIFIDEDKNYRIQIACAGYDETGIDLEFDKESLIITFDANPPVEGASVIFQGGIKNKKEKYSINFYIDTRKFDVEKLSSSIKNGLLDISIPSIPNKKFKVGVGKDAAKDKEEVTSE